jgi:hypothetical protein
MKRRCRGGFLLLPVLFWACGKPAGQQASASATASHRAPSALPASTGAPSSEPPPLPPLPEPTCRALRVSGEAQQGSAALASGAQLDGSDWVTLAAGASLTLKHSLSGREIAVAGPALFRACRRGREQVLLARGKVQSGGGMGSRPGAEVLIATPVAAVRYADADFSLTLDDKKLDVEVRAGQVELDPARDTPNKSLKSPLHARDKLSLPLGKAEAAVAAVELMGRCKVAAEAAEASARRVGDRSAPEPLGARAQAHVRARKTARAACTIAASATGLVADPSARAGLWAEAVRWEGLWETIPRPGRVQPGEK